MKNYHKTIKTLYKGSHHKNQADEFTEDIYDIEITGNCENNYKTLFTNSFLEIENSNIFQDEYSTKGNNNKYPLAETMKNIDEVKKCVNAFITMKKEYKNIVQYMDNINTKLQK
jgi:hypothetical protein